MKPFLSACSLGRTESLTPRLVAPRSGLERHVSWFGFLPVIAYIGPGGGLTAIGALLALAAGLVIAFIGFVWYPLRRMRRRRREAANQTASTNSTATNDQRGR